MPYELLSRAVSRGALGVAFLTLVILLGLMLWKDIQARKPLNKLLVFAVAMLALWCIFAWAQMYAAIREIAALPDDSERLPAAERRDLPQRSSATPKPFQNQ
jgi:hypothetical protein